MKILSSIFGIIFLLFFYNYSVAQLPPVGKSIGATKHNLSTTGSFSIKSQVTSEICVFCHTPHSANRPGPIWNKKDTGQVYQTFESSSLQYNTSLVKPDGSSKLCLSCHDGTIALDEVLNLPGAAESGSLQITDSGTGKLTADKKFAPSLTGYTSNLGVNLTNDHPISFVYSAGLATSDGELRAPESLLLMDRILPLDKDGKLQCTSCHDPHTALYPKFLRASIQQTAETVDNGAGAMICLYCHTKKKGLNFNWIGSTHQKSLSEYDNEYGPPAFGRNYLVKLGKAAGMKLWNDGCLMCHDTHTVEGGKRLLLEGTDATPPIINNIKYPREGGNPASEETCYLCHSNKDTESVLKSSIPSSPPIDDIKFEFNSQYHMPIKTADQSPIAGNGEIHDIKNSDLEEIGTELYNQTQGVPNFGKDKRHIECSDCHNPHRMVVNASGKGTHEHNVNLHTNAASGALLGSWGVQPVYGLATWSNWPGNIAYDKVGVLDQPLLYAEYQVCLKCHSSYGFGIGSNIPSPGIRGGSTASGTNDFVTSYTDQAKEFNGSNAGYHPVIQPTGRNLGTRAIQNTPFLDPWTGGGNLSVGLQTMYCSDCHGKDNSGVNNRTPVEPWGPHGSTNPFLLIGKWDFNTGTNGTSVVADLCFRCHDPDVYAYSASRGGEYTGFKGDSGLSAGVNLHATHMASTRLDLWETNNQISAVNRNITCMTCHDAVMHGGGGTAQYKGRNLLTAFKAVIAPCTPSIDPNHCIDETLPPAGQSDEKPYRTSRSRLRVEDREIAAPTSGWGTSGKWVKDNCKTTHDGNLTTVGGCATM